MPAVSSDKASIDKENTPIDAERGATSAFDSKEQKRVLRKLDIKLLPFVSLLYLMSFLDRSNIGNAKVAGLVKDLHLVHLDYNLVAAVFFIPYCLGEVPSNIAMRLFRPSRWIPSTMVAWGIVMTLMSQCRSLTGLIVARVFLGLTEAGLFPGVTYYISLWYPRSKQAQRVAIFYSAATIAGAFGGLLAFFIEKMEGVGHLHGWQWIFCLEGIATTLVATMAFFIMHDYPETAKFLSEDERSVVLTMLREDDLLATHFDKKFIWQAILDYKTYLQIGVFIGTAIAVYSIALFLPIIVQDLKFATARAQLLTIPPFFLGCLSTITVATISDRTQLRGPFIIGSLLVSLSGYIILYTQSRPGIAYIGTILAAMGTYPSTPVALAWCGGNAGGALKRGVVLALVIGIGNLGGICSSFVYMDGPRYHTGHSTIMAFLSSSIVLSVVVMWNYNRLNKEKIALCEREGINRSHAEKFRDMGDHSPLFRYVI